MKHASSFIAITTEGGLLPADFLAELLAPKAAIEGLTSVSYNLAEGERINEQVNRSWNRLNGRWADFKKAITDKQPGDSTTTETRDRWLQPLFQELGYGQRLPLAKPIEVDGRSYPVSHGWSHVPIHLVGSHIDLDRRTPGAVGAAKASPHSLVQQTLNASDDHFWGIVSNGLTIRLLRDSIALTRLSYVEWDLAAIFDGDLYSEFFVLWLVVHQSRFDAERAEQCWLEKWKKIAEDKGLRALENLRPGVARAIEALGAGLVSHPANKGLRMKLSRGELTTQDFYRQVLRVIYRMLFLFVAEDRDLLHQPLPVTDAPKELFEKALRSRSRYRDFYAITRLRGLTLYRAGTPHPDLWYIFQLLTQKLGSDDGCPELALPALGSFLWDEARSTPDLTGALVSNRNFLTAVHALAFVQDGSVRRSVDYKNLGSEELGSVYEGLLELHPLINADTGAFELNTAAGNERKTSGSYYTPDSLVQCLLDSALEPVIAGAVRGKQGQAAADALLKLKICDPAVGSGHFLIAAAHRLAKHVASARSGEDEPSPEATRTALRDVIGRCLYGVDINPMAAELCRVNLWLESLEPGKPLSFLDHHIRVGNSLLGATSELISHGIPDDAFKAIESDDKKACAVLKKLNARERHGFGDLFIEEDHAIRDRLRLAASAIDHIRDDRPEDIQRKEVAFLAVQQNHDFHIADTLADLWCAAFVIKKRFESQSSAPVGITTQHLRDVAGGGALDGLLDEAEALADGYGFFHWHLAYPEVFANCGGFDAVIGNPPWVRQELLKPFKQLLAVFRTFASTANSSVYFLERSLMITRPLGFVAMLTPNKWLRASYSEKLRALLRQRCCMKLLIDFGHSRTLFPGVDTFPAAVAFQPVGSPVADGEILQFVQANDLDRSRHPLTELVRSHAILLPHRNLGPDRWHLEGLGASDLLNNLMMSGQPLELLLRSPILSGVKTGFNQAFYVETSNRDAIVSADPSSEFIFKKFLRGRDISRWVPHWGHQWHIVIPSSQNRDWPWSAAASEAEAETIFASTFPSVHAHLKQFEEPLRARQDKGDFWWELRSCDYYEDFEKPKIIVQCIAYYSQFAFDTLAHYVNNKAIVIPTDDFYVLGILNSRVIWWIVNRTFQHMKDEGLSVDVQFLKRLPIPIASDTLRSEISQLASTLVANTDSLIHPGSVSALEFELNDLVLRAFSLTDSQRQVLLSSLPPRDPLNAITARAAEVSRSPIAVRELTHILPRVDLDETPVFREVMPCRETRYNTCVPLLDLKVAAGYFGDGQLPGFEEWVEINSSRTLRKGMFVAQVVGQSMEPLIPDGAYCLFQFKAPQVRNDVVGLFQLHNSEDPELGGRFTVKRLRVSTRADPVEGAQRTSTLVPDNPEFEPITVEGEDVKFVAEFLEVLQPLVDSISLVLPSGTRYPQPDQSLYVMRVILSMVQAAGGAIDVQRLMNACSLLAVPDILETHGAMTEGDVAHKWRQRFCDTFRPDLFLPKVDDLVQRGEIKLAQQGDSLVVVRAGTSDLVADVDLDFDARFALKVGDSLPLAERDTVTPMATREQLEALPSKVA